MATRYNITSNSSAILPILPDVTYTSVNMGADSDKVDAYIEFYDASGNPATPTAGQVFIYGMPMGKNWLPAFGSPLDATTIQANNSNYVPPIMDGLCTYARVRFLGVTGVSSASVVIYKR